MQAVCRAGLSARCLLGTPLLAAGPMIQAATAGVFSGLTTRLPRFPGEAALQWAPTGVGCLTIPPISMWRIPRRQDLAQVSASQLPLFKTGQRPVPGMVEGACQAAHRGPAPRRPGPDPPAKSCKHLGPRSCWQTYQEQGTGKQNRGRWTRMSGLAAELFGADGAENAIKQRAFPVRRA